MSEEQVTFEELIAFRHRPVAAAILGSINLLILAGMLWMLIQ